MRLIFQVKGVDEEEDQPCTTYISVMIYFTPAFKTSFSDPIHHIKRQVSYANLVFSQCEIPLKLYIFCIQELEDFIEDSDSCQRLKDFERAKENLLNSSDIGILMTGSNTTTGLGMAYLGPPIKPTNPPIAWVYPVNDGNFVHEIGHIFGCHHNPEAQKGSYSNVKQDLKRRKMKTSEALQTRELLTTANYGYHMKGSNMLTIMAYHNETFTRQIPRFSSKEQTYNGVPLGDAEHDNRGQIMKTMFDISCYGDESSNCYHHQASCKKKCSENCCPMYKSEMVSVVRKIVTVTLARNPLNPTFGGPSCSLYSLGMSVGLFIDWNTYTILHTSKCYILEGSQLVPGDCIIGINNHKVENIPPDEVSKIWRQSGDTLKLDVSKVQ